MLTPKSFFLAGNATATVVSKASGGRYTFKVAQGRKDGKRDETAPHFVSVMTGPDNENSFTFLGTIFADGTFRHGKRSPISTEDTKAKTFAWLWKHASAGNDLSKAAEFLPACACARCGRKLTVPTSIENALGPECAGKMGL